MIQLTVGELRQFLREEASVFHMNSYVKVFMTPEYDEDDNEFNSILARVVAEVGQSNVRVFRLVTDIPVIMLRGVTAKEAKTLLKGFPVRIQQLRSKYDMQDAHEAFGMVSSEMDFPPGSPNIISIHDDEDSMLLLRLKKAIKSKFGANHTITASGYGYHANSAFFTDLTKVQIERLLMRLGIRAKVDIEAADPSQVEHAFAHRGM